jgi:hypothetical protein
MVAPPAEHQAPPPFWDAEFAVKVLFENNELLAQ